MRKYYKFFSHSIILILIFLARNPTLQAQKTAGAPSPLHRCWDLDVEGISKAKIASDNANQIFISSENGTIGAINLTDGNTNWKTELGGNILSVIYRDKILYVASLNEADNSLVIRSLSAETGLAKWQKSLSLNNGRNPAISNLSFLSLIQTDDLLFFVTAAGDLYKLAKDTGDELEKISYGENITTGAKLSDHKIAFGTASKNIIIYSIIDKTTTKLSLPEIPTVIYAEPERIITADKFGKLTSFKTKTTKKEWQNRVGAEVSDLTETTSGLVISSNDNFIYLISSKTGGKIWKKRFAGRTAAAIDSKPDSLLAVVNLNGDTAALLDPKAGKIINQLKLSDSDFFTGEPLFVNGSLIFKTNTGLTSYSPDTVCAEKERPEL